MKITWKYKNDFASFKNLGNFPEIRNVQNLKATEENAKLR